MFKWNLSHQTASLHRKMSSKTTSVRYTKFYVWFLNPCQLLENTAVFTTTVPPPTAEQRNSLNQDAKRAKTTGAAHMNIDP